MTPWQANRQGLPDPWTSVRVASLTPSNTEIVAFLGQADDLVAVDAFSDWPPEVEALVDLGPDLQIDVERLAEAEPGLVLASDTVPGMEAVVERVQAAGLEPVVVAPGDLEEVIASVREVAEHLGVPERGRRLAAAMEGEVERVQGLTEGLERPRVHWEWWPDPVIVAGNRGWMPDVLKAAGASNAYAHLDAESPEVDLETVRAGAPEVLALCWQGSLHSAQSARRVLEREGYGDVPAIREARVLEAPEHLFGRPGPRLVEGVRALAARLHPELEAKLGEAYGWLPEDVAEGLALAEAPWGEG